MTKRLAEIISPLVPVVVFFFMVNESNGSISVGKVTFYFLFPAFFSYLSFFLLGLPLINYLKRKNYYNLVTLILGGSIAGLIAIYIVFVVIGFLLGSFTTTNFFELKTSLWGIKSGAAVSFTYWLIDKLKIE